MADDFLPLPDVDMAGPYSYEDWITGGPEILEAMAPITPVSGDADQVFGTLSSGMTGTQVEVLQSMLNSIAANQGYPAIQTKQDGIFGKKTRAAVQTFQTGLGMTASGVVDDLTWSALQAVYEAAPMSVAFMNPNVPVPVNNTGYPATSGNVPVQTGGGTPAPSPYSNAGTGTVINMVPTGPGAGGGMNWMTVGLIAAGIAALMYFNDGNDDDMEEEEA